MSTWFRVVNIRAVLYQYFRNLITNAHGIGTVSAPAPKRPRGVPKWSLACVIYVVNVSSQLYQFAHNFRLTAVDRPIKRRASVLVDCIDRHSTVDQPNALVDVTFLGCVDENPY